MGIAPIEHALNFVMKPIRFRFYVDPPKSTSGPQPLPDEIDGRGLNHLDTAEHAERYSGDLDPGERPRLIDQIARKRRSCRLDT